jgi:hypothetical protein
MADRQPVDGSRTATSRVADGLPPRAHAIVLVAWPSFLAALCAQFVFFALVDPAELPVLGTVVPLSRSAVYTFGFFAFWALCALSSALTLYFRRAPVRGPGAG